MRNTLDSVGEEASDYVEVQRGALADSIPEICQGCSPVSVLKLLYEYHKTTWYRRCLLSGNALDVEIPSPQ